MNLNLKDEDILQFARAKIKEHNEQIKKLQLMIEAFGTNDKGNGQLSFLPIPPDARKKTIGKKFKLTTVDKAVSVLEQVNVPLTAREIMESINSLYPEKKYIMSTFSGLFSVVYRKENSGIKQHKMEKPTFHVKALYALESWFDEVGNFKAEYKQKILDRYGTI